MTVDTRNQHWSDIVLTPAPVWPDIVFSHNLCVIITCVTTKKYCLTWSKTIVSGNTTSGTASVKSPEPLRLICCFFLTEHYIVIICPIFGQLSTLYISKGYNIVILLLILPLIINKKCYKTPWYLWHCWCWQWRQWPVSVVTCSGVRVQVSGLTQHHVQLSTNVCHLSQFTDICVRLEPGQCLIINW